MENDVYVFFVRLRPKVPGRRTQNTNAMLATVAMAASAVPILEVRFQIHGRHTAAALAPPAASLFQTAAVT